jgi:thiamine-phosphate pyrophosphorylase
LPDCAGIFEESRRSVPIWYGISDRHLFPDLPSETYVRLLLESSADVVQLREKDLDRQDLLSLAAAASKVAKQRRKLLLVNGDVEAAIKSRAGGVHLPGGGDPFGARELARSHGRPDFVIGLSVHSIDEALSGEASGADYVLLGPVFPPISKKGRTPIGLEVLREACSRLEIPVIALGGISKENVEVFQRVGAAGVAGISWINAEVRSRLSLPSN